MQIYLKYFLKSSVFLRLAYDYRDEKASVLADLYLPILPYFWTSIYRPKVSVYHARWGVRKIRDEYLEPTEETKSTDFYLIYRNFYQRLPFLTTLAKTHRSFWQFRKLCEFYQDFAIYCPRYISGERNKKSRYMSAPLMFPDPRCQKMYHLSHLALRPCRNNKRKSIFPFRLQRRALISYNSYVWSELQGGRDKELVWRTRRQRWQGLINQ